jgi:hypothetical protein
MIIKINIWEGIILACMCMNFAVYALKHGEPKDGIYNFWYALIIIILELIIYYNAGLFQGGGK